MSRPALFAVTTAKIVAHQRTALGQYLKDVPVGLLHCIEDLIDEYERHLLVKQVAHRVDENHPRAEPLERLLQPLGPQRQIEPSGERMPWHAAEAFREARSIAVVATARDLRAPGYRIPRRVRPLYRALVRHAHFTRANIKFS